MLPLPIAQSSTNAAGATATTDIPVPGIKAGDVLLAVTKFKYGSAPAAVAVADFTVAAGKITAGTLDTSTYTLGILWTRG